MHTEKSGHDNHHDDHADNIKDAHCSLRSRGSEPSDIPAPNRDVLKNIRLPLPPAIAVIAATTEQQENDDDYE